jgi:Tol biopolymer transport system component/tRNA A-37 threonylcarbamoyl transferase component Bud32
VTLDPELERELSDGYVLERELGRGGTATVWLARDLKHDRPVAFKLLHQALASSLGAERFQREIRFAARLQHPHILTVLDSGEAAGRLWFTMPYVQGETLRTRLAREKRLPLEEALRIAREAAQALQYAHDQGVVHRDVKPENILLTEDGSTLVADFGIARAVAHGPGGETRAHDATLTEAGLVVGTPAYMSPEQFTGATDLDGRTDVYSLGCVLYEMLAGTQAFAGATPQQVAARHLMEPVPVITGVDPAVPPAVAAAIARALAKAPEERFSTPRAFAAALAEVRPPGTAASGSRRRLLIGAGLAGAVVAGFILREVSRGPAPASAAVASGFNRRMAQLTSREGVEEWPAWSPDGARLAYSAEIDGYLQLMVRTVASGEERQLTRARRDHIQPTWSADGQRLAFVRPRAEQGKLSPSDIDGWYENGDIWVIDADGRNEGRLVSDAYGPAFSPDGGSLAFEALWAGARRIWVADARGRNARQVTTDSTDAVVHVQPKWSPDGRRIVYRRSERTQSDIAAVDLTSQAMLRLTADAAFDLDPAWSPDGRAVYYTSARGGGLNLWRMPLDASGVPAGMPEQITTGAGDDIQSAIGPGGQVAFAVRGINSDLWRLPVSPETGAATGEPESVAAGTRVESRGAWAPDGSAIAFNSDRLGEMNIWIRTLASGTDRQLTTGAGGDYQPQWSSDGSRVAFFSAREGNQDIWTAAVGDGALTRLTSDPAMDINPFYSPDGSRIAFFSDRSGRFEIWVMAADGSDQRQVTTVGVWGHFVRWTADGSALVFRADDWRQVRIYRVRLSDGTMEELPKVESGGHMSLSPSGTIIMDVRGHRTLLAHTLDGRPSSKVFEFANPDVRIDYPVWSPDGRWVLFDRAEPRGADLWTLSEQ